MMPTLIKYFAILLIGIALGIWWHTEQVKRYETMFSQTESKMESYNIRLNRLENPELIVPYKKKEYKK
jgi:hypothetical protein